MTTTKEAISHYQYGIDYDIFSEPVISYAKLSIEALEKQIPKKVVGLGYFYGYIYINVLVVSLMLKNAHTGLLINFVTSVVRH